MILTNCKKGWPVTDNLLISPISEIGKRLGVGRNTVLRLIKDKGLPAFQLTRGGRYHISHASLKEWLSVAEEKYKKQP